MWLGIVSSPLILTPDPSGRKTTTIKANNQQSRVNILSVWSKVPSLGPHVGKIGQEGLEGQHVYSRLLRNERLQLDL